MAMTQEESRGFQPAKWLPSRAKILTRLIPLARERDLCAGKRRSAARMVDGGRGAGGSLARTQLARCRRGYVRRRVCGSSEKPCSRPTSLSGHRHEACSRRDDERGDDSESNHPGGGHAHQAWSLTSLVLDESFQKPVRPESRRRPATRCPRRAAYHRSRSCLRSTLPALRCL